MKEILLASAASLFIIILLFRLIRGVILGRQLAASAAPAPEGIPAELQQLLADATSPLKGREFIREIERRAAKLRAVERARYYFASGEVAFSILKRPVAATHFYIRALRNDPMCDIALDRLSEILLAQKNYRLLERTCWSLLSRMDDDATGSVAWVKCWTSLGSLYSANPRSADRPDAIRKMLNAVLDYHSDEEEAERGADTSDNK